MDACPGSIPYFKASMWMPSFVLYGFRRLLITGCEGHAYTVAAQLVIGVRHLDAHCLISFLHSGKDGRARPGERVEDTPARHTYLYDVAHKLQRLFGDMRPVHGIRISKHAR